MPDMRVFIGGTYKDNLSYRQKAYDCLRRKHAAVSTMEDFEASGRTVRDHCKYKLEECTHYVLVVGQRYGWIPDGETQSITELEYEWARACIEPGNMQIFFYELVEGERVEALDNQQKLDAFKDRLYRECSPRTFRNEDNCEAVLERSLSVWFDRQPTAVAVPQTTSSYQVTSTHQATGMMQSGVVQAAPVGASLIPANLVTLVQGFVRLFSPSVHAELQSSLQQVIQKINSMTPKEFEDFLNQYRFPFNIYHTTDAGIVELLEALTLLHFAYGDWELVPSDNTANLALGSQGDSWIRIVHSGNRYVSMPKAIFELRKRILKTKSGQKAKQEGGPLLPNRLILDNFISDYTLCEECGNRLGGGISFSFTDVLEDFTQSPDARDFTQMNDSFEGLEKTRVCCTECLRRVKSEASMEQQIRDRIRGLTS
ncbi:DUF4062 domain-containing protein [Tumebacillus sp. ITR2]|uniref:DUF4062 domain-containing protein n=1 Tax=Tumebacillus amylolyticus TaxID=2801339 RepID=A0ABS1JGS0_9BACL|nr:ABC-three component system protein [Tumebacillus amylolyticus]MBL0389485.1 DUF4062 domain-containing protein [Tumebacillus amylolyticus]